MCKLGDCFLLCNVFFNKDKYLNNKLGLYDVVINLYFKKREFKRDLMLKSVRCLSLVE